MGAKEYRFADKNVLIDGAETIQKAWRLSEKALSLKDHLNAERLFKDPHAMSRQLEAMGFGELAKSVGDGRIPLELLAVRASGITLAELSNQKPWPNCLQRVLEYSKDKRCEDLARDLRDGNLVTTDEIMVHCQKILHEKEHERARREHEEKTSRAYKKPEVTKEPGEDEVLDDAVALIQGMAGCGRAFIIGLDQEQAIAQGLLDDIRSDAQKKASGHLADINYKDPFWTQWTKSRVHTPEDRAIKAAKIAAAPTKPAPGQSWHQMKVECPEEYGVDGEDLFLIYQKKVCEQRLGCKISLVTSDWHLAQLAAAMKLGLVTLYSKRGSWYRAEQLGQREMHVNRTAPNPMSMHRNHLANSTSS